MLGLSYTTSYRAIKMGIYFLEDGTPSRYPADRAVAKEKKSLRYNSGELCPGCSHIPNGCMIRYTKNGECILCARLAAMDYYNENHEDPKTVDAARESGAELYVVSECCDKAGHLGIRRVADGKCNYCAEEALARRTRQAPRAEARNAGRMLYTPTEACTECGTVSERRVNNNACRHCETLSRKSKGPRAEARRQSLKWYTPTEACTECGTVSERRVDNNSCNGCRPAGAVETTPDTLVMDSSPDIVISRQDARVLGWGVYRTGKACKHGHEGFRYVSTGNCVTCHRGRK